PAAHGLSAGRVYRPRLHRLCWHSRSGGTDGGRSGGSVPAGTGGSDGRNDMIQLFMKRSGRPVIVPHNLPASHDAMTEAASQLDEASRAGKTEIVEIKSVIANLPSYLGGLEPDSRTQLAQLNRLASIIAKLDSRERNIYACALDGNSINDLNDMIRVAEQESE